MTDTLKPGWLNEEIKRTRAEADYKIILKKNEKCEMGNTFEIGDYVYCTSDNYIISSWHPNHNIQYARFYRVINTMEGANSQLLCLEGPFDANLSRANGGSPSSPTTSYKAENFRDASPYITERGIARIAITKNSSEPIKWVDVRAIVFDNGNIISKHASREEAKTAVHELLKRNPLKQYDVFEYQATGKFPELPVAWNDRTIYTNE